MRNIIFEADLNTSWHIWKRDWTLTNGQVERNWTLCQGLGGSLTIRIFPQTHQKIEASSASLFSDHAHSRRGWHVRPPSYPIRPLEVVRKVVHGWIIRVINERGNIPRRFRNYAVVSARRKKENISLQSFLPHQVLCRWWNGDSVNRLNHSLTNITKNQSLLNSGQYMRIIFGVERLMINRVRKLETLTVNYHKASQRRRADKPDNASLSLSFLFLSSTFSLCREFINHRNRAAVEKWAGGVKWSTS